MVTPAAPVVSRPKREKIRGTGVLWGSWLWVSWFIGPATFVLRSLLGVGGWESLFMVLFSPVIIPALGLLGALPRFILKRRGHRSIPVSVGVAAIASCWGLVLFMFAMPGSTDSSPIDSVVRQALGLSGRAEDTLLGFAFFVWVAAYFATVVLSSVLRPASPTDARPQRPQRHAGHAGHAGLAELLAIVLVPVLLVSAALAVDRLAMHGARDFGGATEADVAFLPPEAQRARQEAQWEDLQERVAPLRAAIAEDGWKPLGGGVFEEGTSYREPPSYTVGTTWAHSISDDLLGEATRARALAEAQGWRLQERENYAHSDRPDLPGSVWEDADGTVQTVRLEFVDDRGFALTVQTQKAEEPGPLEAEDPEPPAPQLTVGIHTGDYWQSRGRAFSWWDVPAPKTEMREWYAAGEWPTLEQAEHR